MARKSFMLVLSAALLCSIVPAHSQTEPNLPEAPGKDTSWPTAAVVTDLAASLRIKIAPIIHR